MDLFYKTDKWQDATFVSWRKGNKDDYISIANVECDIFSLNVCVPDFYKIELEEDEDCKMQMACFGQECDIYTEEEFETKHSKRHIESFFNLGRYGAACNFSGKIKEVNLCKNTYSQNEFYHIVISCFEMEIDTYLNAKNVPDNIEPGTIAFVDGWLGGILQKND